MGIKTNNIPRPIIDAIDLPTGERAEFDYINWDAVDQGESSAEFMLYKGEYFDLGEFTDTRGMTSLKGWDGVRHDSFFSGLVIRWVEDFEFIVVGRYCT